MAADHGNYLEVDNIVAQTNDASDAACADDVLQVVVPPASVDSETVCDGVADDLVAIEGDGMAADHGKAAQMQPKLILLETTDLHQ
jgi:hypothetical protein